MFIEYNFSLKKNILEKALQENIEKCFQILQYFGYSLEFEVSKIDHILDGITLISGKYKILSEKREVIFCTDFTCGTVSYIFHMKNIDPELCFRSSVANSVTNYFGFN